MVALALATSNLTGGPKAYLNWLIFDRNFTFLNGGYKPVTTAAREYGQNVAHEKLSQSITITEPIGMGNIPVSGVDPDGGFTEPISTFFLAEGITVTANSLSSLSIGRFATSIGMNLLTNTIASSFKPLDDVHYNTLTRKTTVVKTNDNYDEMYVDGKRTGYSSRGAWKTYAADAQVFDGYTAAFYSAAYGSLLRDGDIFARLYRNASSTAAQSALMKATVQNRDPTALYVTLAIPAVIITGGELIGAVSAFSGEAAFGSKLLGYQSRLFGRFHPKYLPDGVKGWLNRGSVRTGWSNKGGQHVFRTAVGRPGTKFKIDWFF